PLQEVVEGLNSGVLTRWDEEELARPSRLPPSRPIPFDPTGYGLSTCVAELKLGKEDRFNQVRDEFCHLFPLFRNILVKRAEVISQERDDQFRKRPGSQGEGYAL